MSDNLRVASRKQGPLHLSIVALVAMALTAGAPSAVAATAAALKQSINSAAKKTQKISKTIPNAAKALDGSLLKSKVDRRSRLQASALEARTAAGKIKSSSKKVAAPEGPSLLKAFLPERVAAKLAGIRFEPEAGGYWKTVNDITELYADILVGADHDQAYSKNMLEQLNFGGSRSGAVISGINWGAVYNKDKSVRHTSLQNFDKGKKVVGQLQLAMMEEQLKKTRLVGAVPLNGADGTANMSDVRDKISRLAQGENLPGPTLEQVAVPSTLNGRPTRGIVLADYYDITNNEFVDALIRRADRNKDMVFDMLLDPVNSADEEIRWDQIQKLVDATRGKNIRLWVARLAQGQQIQHRKIYNEVVFDDIAALAKPDRRMTTIYMGTSGLVPLEGKDYEGAPALIDDLTKRGQAAINADKIGSLTDGGARGVAALVEIQKRFIDKAFPILVVGDESHMAPGDVSALKAAGITIVPATNGAIQFLGIDRLSKWTYEQMKQKAAEAKQQGYTVELMGQNFVMTDQDFIDTVAWIVENNGIKTDKPETGKAEMAVFNLNIHGLKVNRGGVRKLLAAGAKVRILDYSNKQFKPGVIERLRNEWAQWLGVPPNKAANLLIADKDTKLHSKTVQFLIRDRNGNVVDSMVMEGSANFSDAGEHQNWEARFVTAGDHEGAKQTVKILHEGTMRFSREPVLTDYLDKNHPVNPLVPDAAKPEDTLDQVKALGLNVVFADQAERNRSSRGGENAEMAADIAEVSAVQIGHSVASLAQGADGKLALQEIKADGLNVRPGPDLVGKRTRQLVREGALRKTYNLRIGRAPTMDEVLSSKEGKDGLAKTLRQRLSGKPALIVTYGARFEGDLLKLDLEGRRAKLAKDDQFTTQGAIKIDILEGLYKLLEKDEKLKSLAGGDGFISRQEAVAYLFGSEAQAPATGNDTGTTQILQMLPKLVEKLVQFGLLKPEKDGKIKVGKLAALTNPEPQAQAAATTADARSASTSTPASDTTTKPAANDNANEKPIRIIRKTAKPKKRSQSKSKGKKAA